MTIFSNIQQVLNSNNPLNDFVDSQLNKVTGYFRDEETNINKIQFDIISEEVSESRTEYTEEPTEYGFNLTQAKQTKRREITLRGKFGKYVSRQSELEAINQIINTKINTFLPYTGSFTNGALSKINEVQQTVQANLASIDRGINDIRSIVGPFIDQGQPSRLSEIQLTLENMNKNSTPIKIVSNEIDFSGSFRISYLRFLRDRNTTNDHVEAEIKIVEILEMNPEGVFFSKKINKRVQGAIDSVKNKGKAVTKDEEASFLTKFANL